MASSEVAFIKFIVKPWYDKMLKVIPDVIGTCMDSLQRNYQSFKDMAVEGMKKKEQEDRKREPSLKTKIIPASKR